MKKLVLLSLFALLCLANGYAQTPQKMSYQCVVRNSTGALVSNSAISMRITILKNLSTTVYVETHTTTTNVNGLATVQIGGGTPVSGTFAAIEWGTGAFYLKTEVDPAGGTHYVISGTSQLLSVPYSLFANEVPANSISSAHLMTNSVTSTKVAAESINSGHIVNHYRNISYPASALAYNSASTVISPHALGLLWENSYSDAAYLMMARPYDWATTTDVYMRIYFRIPYTATGGVQFFIRPRAFDSGDTYTDADSLVPQSVVSVPTGSSGKIFTQTFTIPCERFGLSWFWFISLQRGGTSDTYPAPLQLLMVEIIYTATQ